MRMQSIVVALLLMVAAGCTWVQLTPDAKKVRVLSMGEVGSCKRLGKTTASVLAEAGGLKRWEDDIKRDLERVASNSAADMGGDTIVPLGQPSEDGRQTFAVYKCVNPGSM